jgi:DNA-binding CsgD family transcriptional regulator
MGEVQDQALELRDAAIWAEWVGGMNQAEIGRRRGIDQSAVSKAISRFLATVPAQDKFAFLARALVRMERLHAVFSPLADQGDKGAARVVIQAQALEGRYLGLDSPAKLELIQAQDQFRHQPVDVRAELAALLHKIRGEAAREAS